MLTKDQKESLDIPIGGDFSPVPMDSYTVQIADVKMVKQFNQWRGEEEDILNYMFIILDEKEMPKGDDGEEKTTRGKYLWKRCRLSLNNRSWLYKLAKAVIGRDLTKEELESFDPEALIGKQIRVSVDQQESKDGQKIFNNIVSIAKADKELAPVEYDPEKKKDIERSSTPAQAPKKSKEEVDDFTKELEAERADSSEDEKEDKTIEQLKKELAEAEAKAKK